METVDKVDLAGKNKGKYHLRIGERRKVYRGDKSELEKILKNYKE